MTLSISPLNSDLGLSVRLLQILATDDKWPAVLFLENDSKLRGAVYNFSEWCFENKIKHNSLHLVHALPIGYLSVIIEDVEVLVFESSGYSKGRGKIEDFLLDKHTPPKRIIECYTTNPNFRTLPPGCQHQMWTLKSNDQNMNDWVLTKV
jgi:hypothetical protein